MMTLRVGQGNIADLSEEGIKDELSLKLHEGGEEV